MDLVGTKSRVLTDFHDSESLTQPLMLDFFLWAFYLANIVIRNTRVTTTKWLSETLAEIASPELSNANSNGIVDMKNSLRRYLWVPSIHDQDLPWLWDMVRGLPKHQCETIH